jgi:hypothetical protein
MNVSKRSGCDAKATAEDGDEQKADVAMTTQCDVVDGGRDVVVRRSAFPGPSDSKRK